MSERDLAHALDRLARAARAAGAVALKDFRPGERTSAHVAYKEGGSPVTDADLRANETLHAALGADFPGVGWLSEETADDAHRLSLADLLIVDPIDGTRAFLTGDPHWTVSVALVSGGRPVAGVVYAPALDETYVAAKGLGARQNGRPLRASARTDLKGATGGGPRVILESLSAALGAPVQGVGRIPSLAYRLARVARGDLDFAVASEASNEWDIAAADVLLEEAQAQLFDAGGEPVRYNRPTTRQSALFAAPDALVGALKRAAGVPRPGATSPGGFR